jgi:hypothetical protein
MTTRPTNTPTPRARRAPRSPSPRPTPTLIRADRDLRSVRPTHSTHSTAARSLTATTGLVRLPITESGLALTMRRNLCPVPTFAGPVSLDRDLRSFRPVHSTAARALAATGRSHRPVTHPGLAFTMRRNLCPVPTFAGPVSAGRGLRSFRAIHSTAARTLAAAGPTYLPIAHPELAPTVRNLRPRRTSAKPAPDAADRALRFLRPSHPAHSNPASGPATTPPLAPRRHSTAASRIAQILGATS